MSLRGLVPSAGNGAPAPGAIDAEEQQQQAMAKNMENLLHSCPGQTLFAAGGGFFLGGMFGLFMASMRYDTPLGSGVPGSVSASDQLAALPVREQVRKGFREMGRATYSSAKNFSKIGALVAGSECCIESFRAKNDVYNSVAAGCFTGGVLAAKSGPQAALVGCAGFAAFNTAFHYYMRMPSDEKSMPII